MLQSKTCAAVLAALMVFGAARAVRSADETVTLTIGQGDSLWRICERYLDGPLRWQAVARLNGLKNPHWIRPGRVLQVPVAFLKGVPVEARVTFIDGRTVVLAHGTDPARPLTVGAALVPGDAVRVESGSVELAYEDGVTVLLRSGTQVSIAEAVQTHAAGRRYRLSMGAGRAISHIRNATGQAPRYLIETPSAIAAARGTRFQVHLEKSEVTRCEVLSGVVGIRAEQGRELAVNEGFGTRVAPGQTHIEVRRLLPPPAPADAAPLYRKLPAAVRFAAVPGAAAYRAMLAADRSGRSLAAEQVFSPEAAFVLPDLADGSYFLMAASIDADGLEGPISAPWTMLVRQNPMPPLTRSPEDGGAYRPQRLTFGWLKVNDAVSYQLQIARDGAFADLVADAPAVTALNFDPPELTEGRYYFRIRATAADGFQGIWSDGLTFDVLAPPAAPELDPPEAGKTEVRLRWRDQGPGMQYRFQMAGEPSFAVPLVDEILTAPQVALPRPETPGTYYVRTRTIAGDGFEGPFAPAQTFEIRRSFPWPAVGFTALMLLGMILL